MAENEFFNPSLDILPGGGGDPLGFQALFIRRFLEFFPEDVTIANIIDNSSGDELIAGLPEDISAGLLKVEDLLESQVGETVAKVITGVVATFLHVANELSESAGSVIGIFSNHVARGQIVAQADTLHNPLDFRELISLVFRGQIAIEALDHEARYQGITPDRVNAAIAAQQPILTIADISKLFSLGKFNRDQAIESINKIGYDAGHADNILDTIENPLSLGEILTAWLAEHIDDSVFEQKAKQLSLSTNNIELLKQIAFPIPPPSDLIRFAVREGFNQPLAESLGLNEEFPSDFAKWAKRQGISEEWAKQYWGAHWSLPSFGQGAEMMHRRVIDLPKLEELLKSLDIPAQWRERLIAISFNPLTRVDVRRAAALGLLDEAAIKDSYLDTGYTEENAETLTRFTLLDIAESQISVVRARIFTLYRKGLVEESVLRQFLADLGRTPEQIELIVENLNLLRSIERLELLARALKTQYFKGIISLVEAELKLIALGQPIAEALNTITLWAEEKKARSPLLSIRDLKDAYKNGIISEEEFRDILERRGYQEMDIVILIEANTPGDTEPGGELEEL